MTQWAVRGSLRRVLGGGCDAMGGEREFKEGFGVQLHACGAAGSGEQAVRRSCKGGLGSWM